MVDPLQPPPLPHPDRLFPPEPSVRDVALKLYDQVAHLPLVSPHGHVDAALLADDAPYSDPVALLVRPDHYVLRLLHAHGVPLTDLGVTDRTEPGPVAGPREVWRQLCRHWPVFRGTAMRLWLEDQLADLFAIDRPLQDRYGGRDLRPDIRAAAPAGVPAPGPLPALRSRGLGYHRFPIGRPVRPRQAA